MQQSLHRFSCLQQAGSKSTQSPLLHSRRSEDNNEIKREEKSELWKCGCHGEESAIEINSLSDRLCEKAEKKSREVVDLWQQRASLQCREGRRRGIFVSKAVFFSSNTVSPRCSL